MTCQDVVALVTAYLDDALPAAERARFEAHVAACDGCATYLAQFDQTLAALGALGEDDLEPAALDALLRAFREWRFGTGPAVRG